MKIPFKRDVEFSQELSIESVLLGDKTVVVTPKGSIDSLTAKDLKNHLDELHQKHESRLHVLLDMMEVRYISSLGLGVLIEMLKRAREGAVEFALYDTQRSVQRVLEISKLDFLLLKPELLSAGHPFTTYVLSREPERKKLRESRQAREAGDKAKKK